MDSPKGVFRQPRQYNHDCDKSASQFMLHTDSLCKVSDFDLQTGKGDLPKIQTMQNQERAIFWLYNHNLADTDAVRSIIVKSSCNLQNGNSIYNLKKQDSAQRTDQNCKEKDGLVENLQEVKHDVQKTFKNTEEELYIKQDNDYIKPNLEHQINKQSVEDGKVKNQEDLYKKFQPEAITDKLQRQRSHPDERNDQYKEDFVKTQFLIKMLQTDQANKVDLYRKIHGDYANKEELRKKIQSDLLIIEELRRKNNDPQMKEDLHKKLQAERDCTVDKEIEVMKRIKSLKAAANINKKDKIGIKFHDEYINLESVEQKKYVGRKEQVTQTPNIGTDIGIQNGESDRNAKSIQTDEIRFSKEEIVQLMRDVCSTCSKGVGVNMGRTKEGRREKTKSFKNASSKGTQMYEHITESDLYTLDWINYNLFSVNVNPHNLIVDQKLRDVSETTTGKSSIIT